MAQKKLGGGRNGPRNVGRREKRPKKRSEAGEIGGKSRQEEDLLPCFSPL